MHQLKSISIVAILSFLCFAAAGAEDKSPEEVMNSHGLVKSGAVYVLDTDAKLPDKLRALRLAQKLIDDAGRKRIEIERDLKSANSIATIQDQNYRELLQKLDQTKDAVQRGRFANQVKAMESLMRDAARVKGEREKELAKLADPRAEYVNLLFELLTEMEATVGRYETVAVDLEVKAALAKLIEKTRLKLRLGPSAQFTEGLVAIRTQREAIHSTVIPLVAGGIATPHIRVALVGMNGTLTRPMLVDPGATLLSLTANTARDLGLTPAPEDRKVHLISTDGKVSETKVMILKRMRLGAFTLENVECAVQPGSFKNAENILGGPVLHAFTGHLDADRKELRLSQMIGKTGAVKEGDAMEITFAEVPPAPEIEMPAFDPAGKILLVSGHDGEREVTVAACEKYGLAYEVTDSFNAAKEDYRAYRAILCTSNQMDYWGNAENKSPEAFAHIHRFIEGGGHLIVFGSFNARNMEQLKPYGIICSYFHGDYFEAVPGLTDQLMAGNEDLLPPDKMLHTAGNFKCTSPHVVLLRRTKKNGDEDGPLMVTLPWKKGRITFNVVEPGWKQPHEALWLLTATMGWVSRGAPMEAMQVAAGPTTKKAATTRPVEKPPAEIVIPTTKAAKSVPGTEPVPPGKPNIFTEPPAVQPKK